MLNSAMPRLIKALQKLEEWLLVAVMLIMLLLAATQILLRNFFDSGIAWGDSLLRVMVLWLALLGAMIASRNDGHIRIDLVSRALHGRSKRINDTFCSLFTAAISGILCYHSYRFVSFEYADGITLFAKVPAWAAEIILPVAFAVIALRYILLSLRTAFYGPRDNPEQQQ